jgi:hypothetical protein
MNDSNVVDIEPIQRRSGTRRSDIRLHRADLRDIAGAETLVLATAIAEAFLNGMELKAKRRMRNRLLLIACGLAFCTGMMRLAIYLIHSGQVVQ